MRRSTIVRRVLYISPFLFLLGKGALAYTGFITKGCNVDLPTVPQDPPNDVFPGTLNGSTDSTCLSGNMYATRPGDTCHSIAVAHSVAEGTIWALNNLTPDCSRLGLEGNRTSADLCLPKTCQTLITSGDLGDDEDCWSIATAQNLTFAQFLAYNPSINRDCSNLNLNGSSVVVCISSPDGTYTPTVVGGSGAPGGNQVYATTTVSAPGPTPFGTTAECGGYYQIQVADFCSRISLSANVPLDLFEAINPAINSDCSNLVPDFWYCVHPLRSWYVT